MSKPDPMPENQDGPPGDLPPCLIYVDEDGRFWHQGAEMVHKGINSIFFNNVTLDEHGRYIIEFKGQRCFAEVEDTFFVVVRINGPDPGDGPPERLTVTLNDGTKENLDPSGLRQADDNVMYARVKDGRFPARILRAGYYQLAEYVIEKDGRFVLPCGGKEWPIG